MLGKLYFKSKEEYIATIKEKLKDKKIEKEDIDEVDENIKNMMKNITEGTKKSGTPNIDVNLLEGDLKLGREIPNEDKYKLKKSKLLSVTNPKKANEDLENLKTVVQYILRLHNFKLKMKKKLNKKN